MSSNVVKKGTTIFTGKPFAFVLCSEHRTTRCDNCFKSVCFREATEKQWMPYPISDASRHRHRSIFIIHEYQEKIERCLCRLVSLNGNHPIGKLLRCSSCQYVYYCDRNCQKESWLIHKAECVCLKKVPWKKFPDMVRLMARVIFKLNQGGADEVEYYTEKDFRSYKDLMSHYADIKADEKRMMKFTIICGILFQFLDKTLMPNTEELMNIYCKICINGCNILDVDLNVAGIGLYLGPSVLDHSCKPNAVIVFEGTTIIVRTLTDLPSLDWSQIRVSYIDLLQFTKARREDLSHYYFSCDCERCKNKEPMDEAAACPNPSCDSPCSIQADKCKKCSARISLKFKKKFQEVADFAADITANHIKGIAVVNLNTLYLCKLGLEMQKGVMHKCNIFHVYTLTVAYMAAAVLNVWKDAEIYGKALIPSYIHYYGEISSWTGNLYFMIGEIQMKLGKPKEALQTLIKANAVLMITHGERHSFVKEKLRPLLNLASIISSISNHDA